MVVCLGRYGDVCNALPIAKALCERQGVAQIDFLIAAPFASILDGVSYVRPTIWDRDYSEMEHAMRRVRASGYEPIPAQVYGLPAFHKRMGQSYQMEAWREAGMIRDFGTRLLEFDRRDMERELALYTFYNPEHRPMILASPQSISSPIAATADLVLRLRKAFPDHCVVDLSEVMAVRIFDLLGLLDRADVMVSVDTVHLHLARASTCPVFAILNDGWRGSIAPPAAVREYHYNSLVIYSTVNPIVSEIQGFLKSRDRRVFHAVNVFGDTARHKRARKSWAQLYRAGMVQVHSWNYERSAKDIGDPKPLPYLNDILAPAIARAKDDDIILWCNDDTALDPRVLDWVKFHIGRFDAVTMRRDEPGHCGRELMAFSKTWLVNHPLPNFFIGTHQFDIAIAAKIRWQRGIISTVQNMSLDFEPADSWQRYALHEPHENEWSAQLDSPAAKHNERLFNSWLSYVGMDFWK